MCLQEPKLNHVAVKEAVLPFDKFAGADTLLGPEMRSTGEVGWEKSWAAGSTELLGGMESTQLPGAAYLLFVASLSPTAPSTQHPFQVMGIDVTFGKAYAKAAIAAGQRLPQSGNVFITMMDKYKEAGEATDPGAVCLSHCGLVQQRAGVLLCNGAPSCIMGEAFLCSLQDDSLPTLTCESHPTPPARPPAAVPIAKELQELGFGIMATYNTAAYLRKAGLTNVQTILKVQEGRPNAGAQGWGAGPGSINNGNVLLEWMWRQS